MVHLARAIASLCGVEGLAGSAATRELMDLIGPCQHLVFVLLDGLGMNIAGQLGTDSFLSSHTGRQILATCPSTTACALTSIATGHWPAVHGVTGWFTYLAEFGVTATLLPFTERYSQQPLAALGITPQAALPLAALNGRMSRSSLTLLPRDICDTPYATYTRAHTRGLGFAGVSEAVEQIIHHVDTADEPTYTHLYVPDVDALCHRRGVGDAQVLNLVRGLDRQMARLAEGLRGRGRLVIAADHGLIDVPPTRHHPIFSGDPLLELLEVRPSGDARMPLFHARPGRGDELMAMLRGRFADSFEFVELGEVDKLRLLGPGPLGPLARRRFGDVVGIALGSTTLLYHPPVAPPHTPKTPYVAQHGGLSADEMWVPLVVV